MRKPAAAQWGGLQSRKFRLALPAIPNPRSLLSQTENPGSGRASRASRQTVRIVSLGEMGKAPFGHFRPLPLARRPPPSYNRRRGRNDSRHFWKIVPLFDNMARKVILDVDPGIDDAMALCWALLSPRLDVVAVTAVAGNCAAAQATRNVQAIIEALDPPRWPRIGRRQRPRGRPADPRAGPLRARRPGRRQSGRRRAAAPPPRGKGHLRPGPRRPRRRHPRGPGPLDQYRPGLPTRPRVGLAGGPGGHHGRGGCRARQHHPGRRIQHLLRPGRRPGRLPLRPRPRRSSPWT